MFRDLKYTHEAPAELQSLVTADDQSLVSQSVVSGADRQSYDRACTVSCN